MDEFKVESKSDESEMLSEADEECVTSDSVKIEIISEPKAEPDDT